MLLLALLSKAVGFATGCVAVVCELLIVKKRKGKRKCLAQRPDDQKPLSKIGFMAVIITLGRF
jgi:hypothetical protein